MAAGCAVFAALGWAAFAVEGVPTRAGIACFVLAMVCGGWDALGDSLKNVPHGVVDIHFLMLMVAVGAASIGAWGEGALLLLLFSSAGALEAFAMHRTKRAIDSLFKAQPETATRLDATGGEETVAVSAVVAGDLLVVRPGDMFAVDGEVEAGETEADESGLTGESLPVAKRRGAAVSAGTLNLWGAVRVRVTRTATESSLQKIIRLIREAQMRKAPAQRFTDRFGTGYTVCILGGAAVMFIVWWLGFGLPPFVNTPMVASAFYRAMTLIVVASPCALVLSVPSAILAAIARGARNGILFRGGAALERLAEVDCVALDKTGTLTTGELAVDRVESFPRGNEAKILALAMALEANASHPIARAIVAHGKHSGIVAEGVAEQFQNTAGLGVEGVVNGAGCVLGRREFVMVSADCPGCLTSADCETPVAPEYSEVWVRSGASCGRILLRDQLRGESAPVLAALKGRGVRTVMLTGDRREVAQDVGIKLGLQEIASGLTPAEKVARVRELGDGGHRVAMVGDGLNDAPCLAAAHVSVGMGAHGSDAAIEQCDIVLMNDRIDHFLDALDLSVRARKIIRQNLGISLGTIIVMVLVSAGMEVPLSAGVLAHEGSTVLVCLNSLRLLLSPNRTEKGLRRHRNGEFPTA
jgi:Cd2+/Zn2+-exporting ATPase